MKPLFLGLILLVSGLSYASDDDFEITHAVVNYDNTPSDKLDFESGMTLIIYEIDGEKNLLN